MTRYSTPRLSTEEFIRKARSIHGARYDYTRVKYSTCEEKVEVVCREHGSFWIKPSNHIYGKRCGCRRCSFGCLSHFLKKAKEVHGDRYDYSRVNLIDTTTKVEIVCKEHGPFWQRPYCHTTKKSNCPACTHRNKITTEEFILRARKVHGDRYDYSLVDYRSGDLKVKIICPKHGTFEQRPSAHSIGRKGCPKCRCSKGEIAIGAYLIKNKFRFETQKRFPDCRNKHPLSFDFYLPELNLCIEYDGVQHTQGWWRGEDSLDRIKQSDSIKTEYCKTKSIGLIRIVYKQTTRGIIEELKLALSDLDRTINPRVSPEEQASARPQKEIAPVH